MKKSFLGEFERNSLIVFSISMLSNVINYLYQIIMGNLLSPSDYGLVNTLLSLSIVAGVPSGFFGIDGYLYGKISCTRGYGFNCGIYA